MPSTEHFKWLDERGMRRSEHYKGMLAGEPDGASHCEHPGHTPYIPWLPDHGLQQRSTLKYTPWLDENGKPREQPHCKRWLDSEGKPCCDALARSAEPWLDATGKPLVYFRLRPIALFSPHETPHDI